MWFCSSGAVRFPHHKSAARQMPEMVVCDMKYSVIYAHPSMASRGQSLINLTNRNLASGQVALHIHYMHLVLQGVVEQLTEHLLCTSNSKEKFYIRKMFGQYLYYL